MSKKVSCANLRVFGCTEFVTKKGVIICDKCTANRSTVIEDRKQNDLADMSDKIKEFERTVFRLQKELDEERTLLEEYKNKDYHRDDSLRDIDTQTKILKVKNKELEIQLEQYKDNTEVLTGEVEALRETTETLRTKNEELLLENKELKEQSQKILSSNKILRQEDDKLILLGEEYDKHNNVLANKNVELVSENRTLTETNKILLVSNKNLLDKNKNLSVVTEKIKGDIKVLEEERSQLEEKVRDLFKDNESLRETSVSLKERVSELEEDKKVPKAAVPKPVLSRTKSTVALTPKITKKVLPSPKLKGREVLSPPVTNKSKFSTIKKKL